MHSRLIRLLGRPKDSLLIELFSSGVQYPLEADEMLAGDDKFKNDCCALRFAKELAYLKALLAKNAFEAAESTELLLAGGEAEEVDEDDDDEDEEGDEDELAIVGSMMPFEIRLA